MSALERWERAAHRGDSDIILLTLVFVAIDVCPSPVGFILCSYCRRTWTDKETPRRKTLTLLSPRWECWVRHETRGDLSVLVLQKIQISYVCKGSPVIPYMCNRSWGSLTKNGVFVFFDMMLRYQPHIFCLQHHPDSVQSILLKSVLI
jgi:hypothetical protein